MALALGPGPLVPGPLDLGPLVPFKGARGSLFRLLKPPFFVLFFDLFFRPLKPQILKDVPNEMTTFRCQVGAKMGWGFGPQAPPPKIDKNQN